MRYSDAFLRTLMPQGRAILSRGPQRMGLEPFYVRPGVGGALAQANMPLTNGGATPASQATVLPDPAGAGFAQLLHLLITSGAAADTTAGLFGIPDIAMRFACAAGFVARYIAAPTLTVDGRGGFILGEDFAADLSFEPDGIVGGFGWTKGSDDAATFRWYGGTPGSTVAPTVQAMPADGRLWDRLIAVAAQDPSGTVTGYRLAIDLSDRGAPVVCDEATFTVPSPGVVKGVELNTSPGNEASGQTPVTNAFVLFEGAQIVRSLT